MPQPVTLKKLKLKVLWRPTRPFRTNTQKRCPFPYRGLECKSRKSRNTWNMEWSRAKTNRVLPRKCIGVIRGQTQAHQFYWWPVSHTPAPAPSIPLGGAPSHILSLDVTMGITANLIEWLEKALASFCPLFCSSVISGKFWGTSQHISWLLLRVNS